MLGLPDQILSVGTVRVMYSGPEAPADEPYRLPYRRVPHHETGETTNVFEGVVAFGTGLADHPMVTSEYAYDADRHMVTAETGVCAAP